MAVTPAPRALPAVARVELDLVLTDRCAVHEHVTHANRFLRGETLAVCRKVPDPAQRPRPHRRRIEDRDVAVMAFPEVAAPIESEHVGWLSGQFPDRRLE